MIVPLALREAVINAIVHNDYSLEVPPVFEIYSDRLEITSYGGLPMGLSEDDFFGCRSMPRNRELMRVFKDLDFVEQLGSGMTRILSAYDRNVFSFTSHFMTVKFDYPEGATQQDTPQDTPKDTQQDTLQDELSKIIVAFCKEPHSKKEIAEKCGLKDSNHLTARYLKPLLEQKLLLLTIPNKPTSGNQKYIANTGKGV